MNQPRQVPRSFSLKVLLALVTACAVALWFVTQYGMQTAQFEIKNNQLQLDDNGLVRGQLLYRYSRVIPGQAPEYFDFICSITNLDQAELMELNPGQKFKMKFRQTSLGPLEKQNVYAMFLTDLLKIHKDHLKGYANFEGWTEVVVDGL